MLPKTLVSSYKIPEGITTQEDRTNGSEETLLYRIELK
jgi:hypothetical protein